MDLPECRDPDASDHPISIEPSGYPVTVMFNGAVVARSDRAVILREAGHAPVGYLPREDCRTEVMRATSTRTRCPFKGEARHFTLNVQGKQATDACWTYERPCPVAAPVAEYVAFYPDKVDKIEGLPED